jgi:hypothetical protein
MRQRTGENATSGYSKRRFTEVGQPSTSIKTGISILHCQNAPQYTTLQKWLHRHPHGTSRRARCRLSTMCWTRSSPKAQSRNLPWLNQIATRKLSLTRNGHALLPCPRASTLLVLLICLNLRRSSAGYSSGPSHTNSTWSIQTNSSTQDHRG